MTLTIGTVAPAFAAQDTQGNSISLSDFVGRTVVLYFYPKDDTSGCTKEACSFRDNYAAYQGQDIVVLGVSADDRASHQRFTEKFKLPFPLLVDTDFSIIRAYDADAGGRAQRVTYVINPQGQIHQVYDSVKTETHATDILNNLGLGL